MSADGLEPLRAHVEELLADALPANEIVAMSQLAVHGRRVAFTASIAEQRGAEPASRVGVVDLDGDRSPVLAPEGAPTSAPRWSNDGSRLAWIRTRPDGSGVAVADARLQVEHEFEVPGYAEYLRWSSAGRLLIGVAEPGAQLSDVVGSGSLALESDAPSWTPTVDTGMPTAGRRRLWTWDGALAPVLPATGTTVWDADWYGENRVVATISSDPTESAWYGADLVAIDLTSGAVAALPAHAGQLVHPAADPSGRHVSVIAGSMSDRGLDIGELFVDGTRIDCGADVTDTCWVGEDDLVFAGQRGLDSVVGRVRPSTGTVSLLWESPYACGGYLPEVGASADAVVVWSHGYEHAPRLVEITTGTAAPVHTPRGFPRPVGAASRVRTTSGDGTQVDGVLVTPRFGGPFPLIVHVHGGPVWCWRDEWSMHYPFTPLLVGLGYAVWHPNHRSSSGCGQAFVRAGLDALGNLDAADIVDGVDALVRSGIADRSRVAITGNSYGGFMAAWLPAVSDVFCAAVARSPVTDWIAQHLTSNLPGFDAACLQGDPLDARSDYRERSPLYRAGSITAPMMLMAGARDLATPPAQAIMLHRALVERGRHSTLVVYPEEGHGVRARAAVVDQCARMSAFLLEHCPVRPPADPD